MIVTKPISTQSKLLLIFDDANNGYSSNVGLYVYKESVVLFKIPNRNDDD